MRCLPDSLDIVALTNADNFSRYDAEDMAVMREKGTKVLWQVDYAGRAAEFADAAKTGRMARPGCVVRRRQRHGTAIRSPGFPTPAIRQRCRPQR